MNMAKQEKHDLIIATARDLFTMEHLVYSKDEERPRIANRMLTTSIINIISDSGIIYLSNQNEIIDLWEKIRAMDADGVDAWLIQASVTWRVRSMADRQQWNDWCDHLAMCYGQQRPSDDGLRDQDANDGKFVCLDDETVDRLADTSEFKKLLKQNPWFTYLVTLQLSWHELFNEIISNGDALELIGESQDNG